jgi:predicted DNA-binding antitoxin AbrB/MazE fold protein
MTQIDAVYERGVFRPVEPIVLPEQTRVTVAVPDTVVGTRPPTVAEVLSRRHTSGMTDTAARHDEHQR